MTVAEAKIILAACPEIPRDPEEPELREALNLLAATPALAAWLEQEKAFDRAFARKLASVAPPKELQDAILRGGAAIYMARRLITESTEDSGEEIGALAAAAAPEGGPEKIVPFYEKDVEENLTAKGKTERKAPFVLRAAPSLLAASVILGMAGLWMFVNPQKLAARAQREIPEFTEFAAGMVDSNLGPTRHDHMIKDLQADLQQEHAPIVTDLPTPVRTDELEGWNVMHWENRPVTEVFLDDHATSLELFVVRRADFPNDDVNQDPEVGAVSRYRVTTWTDGTDIYILLRPVAGANITMSR